MGRWRWSGVYLLWRLGYIQQACMDMDGCMRAVLNEDAVVASNFPLAIHTHTPLSVSYYLLPTYLSTWCLYCFGRSRAWGWGRGEGQGDEVTDVFCSSPGPIWLAALTRRFGYGVPR